MKVFYFVSVFFMILNSSIADAAPYYRFWRGWKLDSLTRDQFQTGLNNGFLATTIKVGGSRGLIGYLPILLPEVQRNHQIPDEIALVIYSSEQAYSALRATPEGKAYGDLHWTLFDQDKGSRSLVPQAYQGLIQNESAYDILNSSADWRFGHAVFITSEIKSDFRNYLKFMRDVATKKGLVSYVILVQGNVLFEYQLWHSHQHLKQNWSQVRGQAASSLKYSAPLSTQLNKLPPQNFKLMPGSGINSQFR